MKRIVMGIFAAGLLVACQQDKIAFIDNSKVINEYKEKKALEEKFKKKAERFDKKTDSISKAFQIEAQAFDAAAAKMSQKDAQTKYNELLQKRQFFQQQLQIEEQQLQSEGQKEMDSVVKKVKEFVKDFGKKNKYTYILGANEAGSVLYGTDDKDITEEVLKALNEASN
ncbi:OmpH family outer membrane protein [Ascidiimonas sp. W6]|uniref:OmpH family outer membrane protein n=1 Tax=Ascidiimonas meishanensis TaxID=3128903 RepID=UPI0030EC90A8